MRFSSSIAIDGVPSAVLPLAAKDSRTRFQCVATVSFRALSLLVDSLVCPTALAFSGEGRLRPGQTDRTTGREEPRRSRGVATLDHRPTDPVRPSSASREEDVRENTPPSTGNFCIRAALCVLKGMHAPGL